MASIGEFGAAVAEVESEEKEPDTFLLGPDKDTFFVDRDLGFVPFGRFAQAATSGLDTVEVEGAAAVMEMMHDLLGPNPGTGKNKAEREESARTKDQEWSRFQFVATQHKIKIDVILSIITAIMGGESGRNPTPPTVSQPGRSKTATLRRSSRKSSNDGFEPVTGDLIKELSG